MSHQKQKRYATDITDDQWRIISTLIPPPKHGGRPRELDIREVINAIFYLNRSGCQWRLLPKDFPNWSSVYNYFNAWKKDGTWKNIHDTLRDRVRVSAGKKEQPTLGLIDSQSVKTTQHCQEKGYDSGKKTKGRKRHILVDTLGLIHGLVVHPANISERAGAKLLLEKVRTTLCLMEKILADGGYRGQAMIDWVMEQCGWVFEIVKRTELHIFKVLPKRWIVERTFGWFNNYRRLSKDYEYASDTSETMIYIAMTQLMLKRLAQT